MWHFLHRLLPIRSIRLRRTRQVHTHEAARCAVVVLLLCSEGIRDFGRLRECVDCEFGRHVGGLDLYWTNNLGGGLGCMSIS
jgi:hypothetical protein